MAFIKHYRYTISVLILVLIGFVILALTGWW